MTKIYENNELTAIVGYNSIKGMINLVENEFEIDTSNMQCISINFKNNNEIIIIFKEKKSIVRVFHLY